jgi:hypothetical protein
VSKEGNESENVNIEFRAGQRLLENSKNFSGKFRIALDAGGNIL